MTRAETSYAFKCFPRDIWNWLRARHTPLLYSNSAHSKSLNFQPAVFQCHACCQCCVNFSPDQTDSLPPWCQTFTKRYQQHWKHNIHHLCFDPAEVKLVMRHLTATVKQFLNVLYHGHVCSLKIGSLSLVLAILFIKLVVKSQCPGSVTSLRSLTVQWGAALRDHPKLRLQTVG